MKMILLLALTISVAFAQTENEYEVRIPKSIILESNECIDEYGSDLSKRTQIAQIIDFDYDTDYIAYKPISSVTVKQDEIFKNQFNIVGDNYNDSITFLLIFDYCYIARITKVEEEEVTVEIVTDADLMYDGDDYIGYLINDPDHSLGDDELTKDEIALK